MVTPSEAERLAAQVMSEATPEQHAALLDALLQGQMSSIFEKLDAGTRPTLLPEPHKVSGFRVRLDLAGAKPPVWRRLELPGDLPLARLHDVIQEAMGWTNSHLHRFRTGRDHRSPYFVTNFDLEEGEDGVLEDGVRLDQLVANESDELWYEYDFGDGWDHVLKVEKVLDEPPTIVCCTGGRMAGPPEDCGGIGGHADLAAWVRSGYDDALLPMNFESSAHAHRWLGSEWHPDHFDVEEVNAALEVAAAEPVAVTGELARMFEELEQRGVPVLRHVLARPLSHGTTEVTDDEATRMTETYRVFLDVIGDGVKLTGAGYLPPAVVADFAERSGISKWWFGKANREDGTPPVQHVRETARALGLVTVRKGRLTPTAAGARCHRNPQALWKQVVDRLPLGKEDVDSDAGWIALAVVGSGTPLEDQPAEVSQLLHLLGWRSGGDRVSPPPAHSPTLVVLNELAGAARLGWRGKGSDPAVAATARAAIRRG